MLNIVYNYHLGFCFRHKLYSKSLSNSFWIFCVCLNGFWDFRMAGDQKVTRRDSTWWVDRQPVHFAICWLSTCSGSLWLVHLWSREECFRRFSTKDTYLQNGIDLTYSYSTDITYDAKTRMSQIAETSHRTSLSIILGFWVVCVGVRYVLQNVVLSLSNPSAVRKKSINLTHHVGIRTNYRLLELLVLYLGLVYRYNDGAIYIPSLSRCRSNYCLHGPTASVQNTGFTVFSAHGWCLRIRHITRWKKGESCKSSGIVRHLWNDLCCPSQFYHCLWIWTATSFDARGNYNFRC